MTIQSRPIFNNSASDKVGLYPYEPLKHIKLTMKLEWLREHSTPVDRYRVRRCIRQEWFRMHSPCSISVFVKNRAKLRI